MAWPALTVGVVVLLGIAAKWSCLGGDGLTLGETAIPWCYSDVVGLYQGRGLAANPLPYAEVLTEYPPLTGLQWWLAGLVSGSATGFYLATAAVQAVAAVSIVVLLARAGVRGPRLLVVAAAPAMALTATINWDLVAVALLTAGVLAGRGDRPVRAGVLLGLGGLAKVFPLAAVPLLAWSWWRRGDRRGGAHLVGAATATVLAVQVPVALWAPQGWASWVALNRGRSVDWDTVWYGAQVLMGGPIPAGLADGLVLLVGIAGVAAILRVAVNRGGAGLPVGEEWRLLLPVMAWLLLVGKVYSPQYSLWLLPLLALSRVPLPLVWAWLVADLAVILTRFPFLAGQQGLDPSLPYEVFGMALLVRGLLLVAIIALVMRPARAVAVEMAER
ncbi:hypothetical protein BH23ACT9_BH23ACT9_28020 [soil metagenome]